MKLSDITSSGMYQAREPGDRIMSAIDPSEPEWPYIAVFTGAVPYLNLTLYRRDDRGDLEVFANKWGWSNFQVGKRLV